MTVQQGMYNAASLIPHVNNGRATASAPSTSEWFHRATHGIGAHHQHEVHHDGSKNADFTFDWVYAAPLRNPHF
jgi:hypothetical protein